LFEQVYESLPPLTHPKDYPIMAKTPTAAFRFRRSGEMNPNPSSFLTRSNAFAAAFAEKSSGTLLVRRSSEGLEGFLLVPDSNDRAAHDLSSIIGAEFERVAVPELDTDDVGHLVMEKNGASARETQAGIDPSELSRQLVNILSQQGSWIAVTFRRTTTTELKRQRAWIDNRMGSAMAQHHTSGNSPLVVKIVAGSTDSDTTRIILSQVAAALPGFDIAVKAKSPTPLKEAAPYLGVAALIALLPVAFHFAFGPFLFWKFFAACALVAAVLGVAKFMGWTKNQHKSLAAANRYSEFARPGKWKGARYKKPRKEITVPGKEKKGSDGDYPFARDTFLVGASVITGLVAPQAGALSGEQTSRSSDVPPPLLERVGMYFGDSKNGSVYLSADDQKYGVAVVGRAGSGKTQALRSLFAWSMLEKVQPSGLPGFPGRNNALISFESKGDGVAEYRDWSETTKDPLLVIDFSRPDSYAIDLFDVPGTFSDRANFFVNAMVYAFGEGAIQDRSFTTLNQIFAAALAVDATVLANLATPLPEDDASVMYYAFVMLGGLGDKPGVELMAAVVARANELDRERRPIIESLAAGAYAPAPAKEKQARAYVAYAANFVEAAYALKSLAERSESSRRTLTEAPMNKVVQLLGSAGKSWWSKSRKTIGWTDLLNSHRSVIINTGTSELGELVPERLGAQLSSLLMYSLKESISRNCSGWEKQGRSVSIFSDELSLLAGNSPEVLTWLRDQGRSFGVRPFFATQRPGQLPELVRKAFLNFATLISFSQDEPTTAEEIAANVSTGGDWDGDSILHLAPYTAVVRAAFQFKRQTAFTVKVGNFEGNRHTFAADQGYGSATASRFDVPSESLGLHSKSEPFGVPEDSLGLPPSERALAAAEPAVRPTTHRSTSASMHADEAPAPKPGPSFVNPSTGAADAVNDDGYPTLGDSALS
jgi:hypothetical protein